MKFCICFWGLTRSLKITLPTIQKNIFQPLKDNKIEYDIFLHTYDLQILNASRSHENNVKLDPNEFKLLNPTCYKVDNQDVFDKSYNYKLVEKYGDSFKNNFESLRNLIRYLNSQYQVTQMWKDKPKYDFYLYIRPDLFYHDKIDIPQILDIIKSKESVIMTPKWQLWGGINDRLAYGDYEVMQIYGSRFMKVLNYLGEVKKPLNSERFLKWIIDTNKIKNIFFSMRGTRVRGNGQFHKETWNPSILS